MKADTLAIVQNKEITNADLDRIIARYPLEKRIYFETSAGRKQLLEQKVAFILFGLYAKECGKEKEQSFAEQINDLKEQILTQIIMQELFAGVEVTTEEIEKFYQNHPEAFEIEDIVDAKHILVDTKEEADRILTEINNKIISFEDAAAKYSKCPSKEKGGSLGYIKRGMMAKEFEDIAYSIPLCTYSQPVETRYGYHIIEVVNRSEKGILTFEEVKDKIKVHLISEKQQKIYEKKLEELKATYHYEIYEDVESKF